MDPAALALARLAFAGMLTVATPGESIHSSVVLPSCDAACQKTPVCEAPKLVCRPPRFRRDLGGWARAESYQEGLVRYASIARSIGRVASAPPPGWPGTPAELARALVVVARHESAFWRDVQVGTMRGPAGEVCLVQLHSAAGIPEAERQATVGLGDDALDRCFSWGARLFSRARAHCKGRRWVFRAQSLYATGRSCSWAPAAKREKTLWRIQRGSRELCAPELAALEP